MDTIKIKKKPYLFAGIKPHFSSPAASRYTDWDLVVASKGKGHPRTGHENPEGH